MDGRSRFASARRHAGGVALLLLLSGTASLAQGGLVLRPPAPAADGERPELLIQMRPQGNVYGPAFCPVYGLVATGDDSGVRLWDVESVEPRGSPLVGHPRYVEYMAFSANGRVLATAGPNDGMRLWDMPSGQPLGEPIECSGARGLAVSPDGRAVAAPVHGLVGGLQVWDTASGRLRWEYKPDGAQGAGVPAWSPDSSELAVPIGGEVWFLDAATGEPRARRLRQAEPRFGVRSLAYSPDGRRLAITNERAVLQYDLATLAGQELVFDATQPTDPGLRWADTVQYSPDGLSLAAASDNAVAIWAADTGLLQWLRNRSAGGLGRGRLVGFRPDGRPLLIALEDGWPRVDDLMSAQSRAASRIGRGGTIESVAFSPDSRSLVAGGAMGLHRWDLATGRLARPLTSDWLYSVAWSADGRWVATGALSAPLGILDVSTDEPVLQRLGETARSVYALAISPDSRLLAASSASRIWLWDLATATPRQDELRGPQDVMSLAFSPDGKLLASGHLGGGAALWDVATGRMVGAPVVGRDSGVECLAFSPDGRQLALFANLDNAVWLLDLAAWRWSAKLDMGLGRCAGLAFAPDGRSLAAVRDSEVLVFDLASGKSTRLAWHTRPLKGVAYSPDGRRLASWGEDGSVRLWDPATGRRLAALVGLDDGQRYVAVSASGYYNGSVDIGALLQWRLGTTCYPFDTYAARYHRPDLLRRELAGEDIGGARALDGSQVPPNLAFVSPAYGAQVSGRSVAVELEAVGLRPITRVELTVNGQALPAALAQALVATGTEEPRRRFSVVVPLPVGEFSARLRAVAYDSEQLCSRPAELLIRAPNAETVPSTLHVLAVGINRYSRLPEADQLRYATPDAQAIVDLLERQGDGRLYAGVRARLLTDASATLANLKFALRDLKDSANEGDVAVIFISGHGLVTADGEFHFPSHDLDLRDIAGTALSWRDFVAALGEVRAKRVLVLADTCHSGGIVQPAANVGSALVEHLNREAHQMVFTASSQDEVSLGSRELGHGLFTQALIEVLRGADAALAADGAVTFAELRDYVTERVAALSGGRQHPQLPYLANFQPDAVLAAVWRQP